MPISKPRFIDVHTHTQFAVFSGDHNEVIGRALDTGVWLINVGTQYDMSASAVATARRYLEGVYAAVGLHPIHTERSWHDAKELGAIDADQQEEGGGFMSRKEEFDYGKYLNLAMDPKTVAIGECGLDYYRLPHKEIQAVQEEVFRRHIALAHEVKKPLMVHCRNAFADLITILDSSFESWNSERRGVIHFFSGTVQDARHLLGLGFFFSFGGVITFTRDYDEAVRHIPLDRILLETDAPYVAPVPHRGRRNEPIYIEETAKRLAAIKGVTLDEVAERTTNNARGLFRF